MFEKGQKVRTASTLTNRDFNAEACLTRRPNVTGVILRARTGHGLCYEVRHSDGSISCYDPDELSLDTEKAPEATTLKWVAKDISGCAVYRFTANEEGRIVSDRDPITSKDAIREGASILVPSLVGGYHVMSVAQDKQGSLFAKSDKLLALLEFSSEGYWVCSGLINTRGLEKLDVKTEDGV